MEKSVKVYSGRPRVTKIRPLQFTSSCLEYGVKSFYKLGVTWWFLTALYYVLKLSSEKLFISIYKAYRISPYNFLFIITDKTSNIQLIVV